MTRRRLALVAGMAAVLAVVLPVPAEATPGVHGSGVYCARYDAYELHDCGPRHRLPAGALGRQLGWVFEQLGGGAADLTVEEVRAHFTDGFQALFPPEAVLGALQATLAEHGPARLVGYSYPPRADQVLAVGETASGERLVVGLGISAGLIELLDVMGAPPTLVPRGPYNGWYDVGGRRLFLRCTGHGSPTVVFDNGLTADWDPLQQQLSGLTRVCSYDPARQNGPFGRSDPAPAPRTATDRVARPACAARRRPGAGPVRAGRALQRRPVRPALRQPAPATGRRAGADRRRAPRIPPAQHRVIKRFVPPELWPQLEAAACAIPPLQLDYEQVDICRRRRRPPRRSPAAPLRPMPLSVLSHGAEQFPPGSSGGGAGAAVDPAAGRAGSAAPRLPPCRRSHQRPRHPSRPSPALHRRGHRRRRAPSARGGPPSPADAPPANRRRRRERRTVTAGRRCRPRRGGGARGRVRERCTTAWRVCAGAAASGPGGVGPVVP